MLAVPHLHAHDFGQARHCRRQHASPALARPGAAGLGEDALKPLPLDLAPDQGRRVLPLPLRDGPRQQRGECGAHAEGEGHDPDQTEEREAREDRVFEPVHPAP